MNRFAATPLVSWMGGLLRVCGIPEAQAALAAQILGRTSLRGIDTHGVSRIPSYVQKILSGEITGRVPQTQWRDGALQVDGGGALGQVVASHAVDAAYGLPRSRLPRHATSFAAAISRRWASMRCSQPSTGESP